MTDQAPGPSAPQTRGFLFADLRGYSKFTDQHGDAAAAELIGRYRELVRTEIAAFHGAEIRTEGDSFYVVFGSVSEAVQAGLAIRDAAATASAETGVAPIDVGIGIHAGESTDGSQGIVSSAVNIAARVCAMAEPGEVLVTDTVRSLTRTFLPIGFAPRGRRRLKGISEPMRLFRVESSPDLEVGGTRMRSIGVPIAVGAGIVTLLAVAVLAAATRLAPTTGADPTITPEPSVSMSGLASAGPTTDLNAYPNAAEAEILDRLPEDVAESCERANSEDNPEFVFPNTASVVERNEAGELVRVLKEMGAPLRLMMPTRAGLTCLTDSTRVVYWKAGNQGDSEELFHNLLTRRSITQGSCADGGRVYEAWSVGAHDGHVMCFTGAEDISFIEWTFADANIYAIASRRDGDADALYAWWRGIGRLLGR